MTDHAFKVGQLVDYRPKLFSGAARGAYEVAQQMPMEEGEFRYRIRSQHEDHERVARESELSGL